MKSATKDKKRPDVKTDLPEDILRFIEQCRLSPRPESYLIAVLQKIQVHYGYLTRERLDAVAGLMEIPTAKVSGVATFYHFFSFIPKGRHRITVCMGTACYVKGGGQLLERLKESLGVDVGHTTPDGAFSLDAARCLGSCALAPVMVVDEKVYGSVTPEQLPTILGEYGFEARGRAV